MRIAQISDLHIRSHLPGSSSWYIRQSRRAVGLFRIALRDVVKRLHAEVVVVSGDLLDVPFYLIADMNNGIADKDQARAVRMDYELIRELLDSCGLPYIVVPGNHDYAPVLFDVFSDQSTISTIDGIDFVSFAYDEEDAENYPIRNMALYRDVATRNLPQVHIQHYVITPEINPGYPHTYRNADTILEWNREEARPLLALSGHYHRGVEPIVLHGSTYVTAAALCEYPFMWYSYDANETEPGQYTIAPHRYDLHGECPVSTSHAVDLDHLHEIEAGSPREYAVITRQAMDERACDAVWSELTAAGHKISGVFSLPDEEAYDVAVKNFFI